MQKLLVLIVLMCVSAGLIFADGVDYGIGGGIATNTVGLEVGGDIDADGWYGMFRGVGEQGVMINVSLSSTDAKKENVVIVDPILGMIVVDIEDEFLRLAVTGGYMFRRDEIIRPFLHAGFAYLQVEETASGIPDIVDDSFVSIALGVGLEVGKGHNAFFSDLVLDINHSVRVVNSLGDVVSTDVDLLELHVGYLYKF